MSRKSRTYRSHLRAQRHTFRQTHTVNKVAFYAICVVLLGWALLWLAAAFAVAPCDGPAPMTMGEYERRMESGIWPDEVCVTGE